MQKGFQVLASKKKLENRKYKKAKKLPINIFKYIIIKELNIILYMRQIFYMINIFMWTKYSVWIRLELYGPDYNYQLIVSNKIIKSKKK